MEGNTNLLEKKLEQLVSVDQIAQYSSSGTITLENDWYYLIVGMSAASSHQGLWACFTNNNTAYLTEYQKGSNVTMTASGLNLSVSLSTSRNTRFVVLKLHKTV